MEPMAAAVAAAVPWTAGRIVWLLTYPDPANTWRDVYLPALGFALLCLAALGALGAVHRRRPRDIGSGNLADLDLMLEGERL